MRSLGVRPPDVADALPSVLFGELAARRTVGGESFSTTRPKIAVVKGVCLRCCVSG